MSAPEQTLPQSEAQAEAARTLGEQLDRKADRLERLISKAEALITKLEQLTPPRSANASHKPASVAPSERLEVKHERPLQTRPPTTSTAPPRETEPADSLRRAIYALADTGRSPLEIARELDEHVGKVELILALRYG